jgi:large subunit ribosomal protein L24
MEGIHENCFTCPRGALRRKRMGFRIKKNDTVIVIKGEEKGKRGRILAVYPDKGAVLVEKLNLIKKHMKPSKKQTQGGIIEKEAPIRRANVMLICSKCDRPAKIGQKVLEDGVKVRICKKCMEVMD